MKITWQIHAIRKDGIRSFLIQDLDYYPTPDDIREQAKFVESLSSWKDSKYIIVEVRESDMSSYDQHGKPIL